MTVTPLMWRSLDNFSKLFAYMPPFPLEWNVSKQKMVSRTNSKDLFFWKILMFWLFVAILVLLILPLAKIYGFAEIKFPTMMIIVLVGSADGLVELLELVTKSCAENAAVAFNLIVVLEKQIHISSIASKSKISKDIVGIALNLIRNPNTLIPPTWLPFTQYIFIPLKYTLIFQCCLMARVMSFLICAPTLAAYLMTSCISSLSKNSRTLVITGRSKITQYFFKYSSCQIILAMTENFSSQCVAIFMFYGFVLCVLFIFVSLKMYHVIPLPLFLVFPTFAVSLAAVTLIMLPVMISIFKESKNLRNKWKRFLTLCYDKRHVKRQIMGKRCLRIYAGLAQYNFFMCQRSTMTTYGEALLSYTITALMSFDTRDVQIAM
ncbi:hypothetical protein Fcan01_28498 [Folsomia candida]|uniref:Uncharacterized protein n=1 Tax=Folsomia candida TaxID=158441 RepID=A0A226CTF7_FOLCA|nr:hypothetical protein Fcan01_28498 [Folsomia candida]